MGTDTAAKTRERQFLEVFQKVTKMVSMVLDHQQVMDTIVRTLPELFDVDACTIRLLDYSTNTFVLGAAHGLSMEYVSRQSIDTEETMALIKAGQPVARVNLDRDPNYRDREELFREGIKSILTLPILFQDSIIGIMRLLTRRHRVFSDEEISFSMSLAEQVGIAISNARMFKEMVNQVDFMQEVQALSKLVNSTLDLDTVLQTIVERVPRSMGTRACTIRLLNPQTNTLELVAAHGVSERYLEQVQWESEDDIAMLLSGGSVAIFDVESDERIKCRKHLVEEGIRSLLCIPIKVGQERIGVLQILSDEHHCFTSSEVNFAETVSEAGGTAIHNARTYQKINLLFNQIEENERFLADILDCIRPQLLVIDTEKHVVLANRVALERLGRSEKEILGAEYSELCLVEGDGGDCPVDQVLRDGTGVTLVHQVQQEDGIHWLERTATPMLNDEGRVQYVVEIIRDITTQRKLEQERMERVKLQGVVEMAGAVAHEINSPLFAALGTAQLLEEDVKDTELSRDLATIVRNLKAISELTKKMTSMTGFKSRNYIGDTRIVDMSD